MSATIHTKVSDEVNATIDKLVEEKGMRKADIIRDLLNKGLDTEQMLSATKEMKEKLLEVETVKQTISELTWKHGEQLKKIEDSIHQMARTLTEEIRKLGERL